MTDPDPDIHSYEDLERIKMAGFDRFLAGKRDLINAEARRSPKNQEVQAQCEYRHEYADRLKQRSLKLPFSRSVFIAYSETGRPFIQRARTFFKAKDYLTEEGKFHHKSDKVSENIVDAIEQSRFFLAIWSRGYVVTETLDDKKVRSRKQKKTWIPSMWMPFELATAITLNKRIVILWVKDPKITENRDVFEKMIGDNVRTEIDANNTAGAFGFAHKLFEDDIRRFRPYKSF